VIRGIGGIQRLTPQPDGKLFVSGDISIGDQFYTVRLDSTGAIDTTLQLPVGLQSTDAENFLLGVRPNNDIVVAKTNQVLLLDPSGAVKGYLAGSSGWGYPSFVGNQPDGSFVLSDSAGLLRYASDGDFLGGAALDCCAWPGFAVMHSDGSI